MAIGSDDVCHTDGTGSDGSGTGSDPGTGSDAGPGFGDSVGDGTSPGGCSTGGGTGGPLTLALVGLIALRRRR